MPVPQVRSSTLTWAATAGVLARNAVATVRNRNRWPFCSYNMFYGVVPPEYPQLRGMIHWADPSGSRPPDVVDVRGLLPFEFFRTVSLLEHVYVGPGTEADKEACARAICTGLNQRPWGPRDEVVPSIRRPHDPDVAGIDILLMRTAVDRLWDEQVEELYRYQLLYSYRDGGGG